ncbi:MAG TPA: transposase, partial [Candidatus Binatia bacterium]|nr:transposase [Candidatus Binatia bacterium]
GRRPRIHFPGGVYHVISRGNQRQVIFNGGNDYHQFQVFLEEAQKRYSFTLYAYVLMPNHFHLLIEVGSYPLSKVMQTLLYRYTRYYNKRHNKVGHLFQGRYRAILCDKESYLMELIRYLHLNPVRAGLVKDAKEYVWSSHGNYLKGRDTGGVSAEEALSYWSKRRSDAVRRYKEFVLDGVGQGHREEYYEVKDQRYLGEEDFIERVERGQEKVVEASHVRLTIEEVVEEIARYWRKDVEAVLGSGREREASKLRAIAAYVGREVGGHLRKL